MSKKLRNQLKSQIRKLAKKDKMVSLQKKIQKRGEKIK